MRTRNPPRVRKFPTRRGRSPPDKASQVLRLRYGDLGTARSIWDASSGTPHLRRSICDAVQCSLGLGEMGAGVTFSAYGDLTLTLFTLSGKCPGPTQPVPAVMAE